jgi:hypothetical protein
MAGKEIISLKKSRFLNSFYFKNTYLKAGNFLNFSQILFLFSLMIFCAQHSLSAQSQVFNKYGLYVIIILKF